MRLVCLNNDFNLINLLKSLIQQAGLTISDDKIRQLEQFIDLFIEKNKVINLTKIKSKEEFLIKHIIDALFINQFLDFKKNIKAADLGTGGGLPGIPLAILHPDTSFTLIDSVKKKIKCVEEFADKLSLNNVIGLSDRLEAIGQDKKYREQFDLVLVRALAPLPVLLELALPLTKVGGQLVAFKGPGYFGEINEADKAMQILKAEMPKVEFYELPKKMGKHYLLIFKKNKSTPKTYPRRVGMPERKPL